MSANGFAWIFIWYNIISFKGLSFLPTGYLYITSKLSSPSITLPNKVYFLFNFGNLEYVIKNWLPFVLGPEFAIDTNPLLSYFKLSSN